MGMPRSRSRFGRWRKVLLGTLALGIALRSTAAEVEIVVGDDSPVYAEAAEAIVEKLSGQASTRVVSVARLEHGGKRTGADAVVTLGSRALQAELASSRLAPIVATLVTRTTFEQAIRGSSRTSRTVSAIFVDQSYSRQINLIRTVVPERTRVGVLFSLESEAALRQLQAVARNQKLELISERVANERDLPSALRRLLPESEVLLALPDSTIFNASSLPNILLSAYRQNQPLFGFSAAYVRAGALAAIYSTPRQLAQQAAEAVARFLAGSPLPPPQHPSDFTVNINKTVARSLNIAVEEEQSVKKELKRLEREP